MLHNDDDSPPQDDLISSLHRHGSATYSASSTWKIRTNQLALDDIRRERRAAVATANFNCRRLSYNNDLDDLADDFLHGNDHWNGFPQDQIVVPSIQYSSDSAEQKEEELPVCLHGLPYSSASSSSSSFASSSVLGKEVIEQMAANTKVEQNVTPTVGEKTAISGNPCKIRKWEVILAWLVIASVAMFIFSLRCLGFGAYGEQRLPFLLVPT